MKAVGAVLDGAFHNIFDNNPVGSIAVVVVGILYLLISFLRHSGRTADAEAEVLRIANQEGSTENDWAPFAYTAGQHWIDIPRARAVFFGMISWGISSGLVLALGSEVAASLITLMLIIPISLYMNARDAVRDDRRFEDSLKAANEGRWFPAPEVPKDHDTKDQIMDKVRDLPADLLSAAQDSIDDDLK
jgi:hypothetical protein